MIVGNGDINDVEEMTLNSLKPLFPVLDNESITLP